MPPDLTISSIPPAAPQAAPRPLAQTAAAQAGLFAAASVAAAKPNADGPPQAPSIAIADNRVVLDPSSDRVVLEYFDATGALINSLPSQRQLDAYRLAASSSASPAPEIKKP